MSFIWRHEITKWKCNEEVSWAFLLRKIRRRF